MKNLGQKTHHSKRKSALVRGLLITGMTLLMSFGTTQTATAGPAIDEFVHTIECALLLITDQVKHLEECGTNDNVVAPSDDITYSPPPPPPPPPPPETESSPQ